MVGGIIPESWARYQESARDLMWQHALKQPRLTFYPCPFQLVTDLVDAACDLFKLCPLHPGPTFQHFANASKFLGCGPEPMFSLGHIHTDPENFAHFTLVIKNTF